MPGIIALIDGVSDKSLLSSMAHSITHKKWQQTDLYVKPSLAIGRVHLGIINPEPQPIFNEDESICIVMDGEVFDYEDEKKRLELRGHKFKVGNDPEFCLHLFEEYGERFVEKLNGSFVLVIHDANNEKVLIANDRHGLRPFYYTRNGDRYIFASEVKAILADKTFKKDIDHEAVADFFAFGRIIGNKTFFKKIKMMPPASLITWSKGKISTKKYADFKFEEENNSNLSEEYYVNKLVSLFRKAVERRTKGKHRIGVFLSGGLDSRTVAAAMRNRANSITTFTYGVIGGDEPNIAKKVSKKLGARHEFKELRKDFLALFSEEAIYLTDGMLNCAHMYWISLLPVLREHVDVMFHGTSLDILLGTYLSRVAFRHSFDRMSQVFLERKISQAKGATYSYLLYEELNTVIPEAMAPLFYSETYYQQVRKYPIISFRKALKNTRGVDAVNRTDYFFLRSLARYNLSIVLVRNYVEDRLPGLDNDFFEFALTIPRGMRFGYKLYHKFLTKLAPELASVQYQRTGIPPSWPMIAHRIGFLIKGGYKLFARKLRERTGGTVTLPQKIGYPDLDDWIRKDRKTRTFFESILLNQRTLSRNYFNREYIFKMVDEHMNGKKNWGIQLCALLTFELWHRLFIDESPPSCVVAENSK